MLNLCKDYVKFLYKTLTILFETTLQLISNIGCLLLLDHSEIPFIAFIIIVPTINANTIKTL